MKNKMKAVIVLLIIHMVIPLSWASPSGKTPLKPEEIFELGLEELMEIEIFTELATKTKLGVDLAPGMVTVLKGPDLENQGIRKVWEALELVPGFGSSIDKIGQRQTPVRGIGGSFASGKIKVLLNNVSMNNVFSAQANPVLNMPVEQVERIEVIRGPGSAIHGEFAYAGVVNVVTRKEGQRIHGSFGSYETYGGGGEFSWSDPKKDLKVSMNLAGWRSDGADVLTGPDYYHETVLGAGSLSNAPGRANEDKDYQSGIFTMDYNNFSFLAQYIEDGHGDHFGFNMFLTPPDDRIMNRNKDWALEARQTLDLFTSLKADIRLSWQEHTYEAYDLIWIPAGSFGYQHPDASMNNYWKERQLKAGLDLTWEGWNKHSMLMGFSIAGINVLDEKWETNIDLDTYTVLSKKRVYPWMNKDQNRTITSVTFQDEYRITDSAIITGGFRYDHYDDVGGSLAPRIAAVYRWTPQHIFKAQYSRAFRPPTFWEMSDSESLDPETVETYELGYIHKRERTVGRVTMFYSNLKDPIALDIGSPTFGYINHQDIKLRGVELELKQRLGSMVNLDANLSFVDTEGQETGKEIEESTNWLANVGLRYEPLENLVLTTQYRYVGERNRAPGDSRKKMAAYHTVDVTGNIFNLGLKGFTLRAGVKNLFDEDVRYPAPLLNPFGTPFASYPDDFPRPGRRWWMQVSYEF